MESFPINFHYVSTYFEVLEESVHINLIGSEWYLAIHKMH